jgi:hypothetical protein
MIKYRKSMGFASGQVVLLILLLIFAVGLIVFLGNYDKIMQDMAYDKACNDYIQYSVIARKAGFGTDFSEAPCRKKDITIEGNTKFEVLKEIFNKQVECYNSFKRGNVDLFELGSQTENVRGVRFCGICHSVNFSKKDLSIDAWEYITFQELKARSGKRYIEILAPKEFVSKYLSNEEYKQEIKEATENEIVVDTSKTYLTIFVYDKNKEHKLWQYVGPVLLAPLKGFEIAHADDAYRSGIYLVEHSTEELNKVVCDYVMGLEQPGIT